MREKIYKIIEPAKASGRASRVYDYFMMAVIFISLVPLAFKADIPIFRLLNAFAVAVFIIDYALRLLTADYKFGKQSVWSFLRYPFSVWAIIDLVSILPSLLVWHRGFQVLRVLRAVRVFRVFKALRYSKSFGILARVFKKTKAPLFAVFTLSLAYVLIFALVAFNLEPDTFSSYFEAVYWAVISLTTMGYGDIYPVTTLGRAVTILSSIMGVAVIALPAGIITAGYMGAIEEEKMTEAGE